MSFKTLPNSNVFYSYLSADYSQLLMGGNQSQEQYPILPNDKTELIISNQCLIEIPYRIPKKNKLIMLDISHNSIASLPTRLKKLEKLFMSHNNLHEIPPQFESAFASMKRLQQLDLSYNCIATLPQYIANIQSLSKIILAGNNLQTIPNFQEGLQLVDLSQNKFEVVQKLPSSVYIVAYNFNQISHIDFFLPNLRGLFCSMNRISSFQPGMMLNSLVVMDLSMNLLTSESLPNLQYMTPSLTNLDLSYNSLTSFPSLPRTLTELNLSHNHIKEVPKITELTVLEILKLQFNEIETIGELPTSLSQLYINDNKVKAIQESPLARLQILQMHNNKLEELPKLSAIHIKELFLMSNSLKTFFVENINNQSITSFYSTFDPSMLTKINLSDNQLDHIPPDLFNIPNLIYLNVSKNNLTKLPVIIQYSKLLLLNISENPFKRLKFNLPESIKTFYCSSCELTELPESMINCTNLSILICSENQLKAIPQMPSIGCLNASNNQIQQFPTFSLDMQQLDLSMNELASIPDSIDSLTNLVEIDLSHNKIVKLPPITNLSHLSVLKISHNYDLEGMLDCSHFLLLETVDVSFTKIELSETSIDNIREVIVSKDSPAYINAENILLVSRTIEEASKIFDSTDMEQIERIHNAQTNNTNNQTNEKNDSNTQHNEETNNTTDQKSDNNTQHNKETNDTTNESKDETNNTSDQNNESKDDANSSTNSAENENTNETNSSVSLGDEIEDHELSDSSTMEIHKSSKIKIMIEPEFVGYAELCGMRDSMEDAILARPFIFGDCDVYSVLDGHGGSDTSNYGVYKIANLFTSYPTTPDQITESYIKKIVFDLIEDLRAKKFTDGATMALAALTSTHIVIAHLGDARVLVIRNDGSIRIATVDHKPFNRSEIERALSIGGKVQNERMDGILAISRSIGDFSIYGVSYEPDVVVSNIEPDDKWLVLCCDGVFDVISNEDVGLIAKSAQSAADLAYKLRNTALVRLSADNISAMAIDIQARNKATANMKE